MLVLDRNHEKIDDGFPSREDKNRTKRLVCIQSFLTTRLQVVCENTVGTLLHLANNTFVDGASFTLSGVREP